MTKFVAALFLPTVMGAVAWIRATRATGVARVAGVGGVTGVVLALVAPWFEYQTIHAGPAVWSTMLGDHVVKRFRSSLDPAHLHPWDYYFEFLAGGLVKTGTVWAVAAGAVLIHARVVRERWLAGTLVLYWFWLPFVLISFGSSKLWHYTYPFLPPVGLLAGRGAWMARAAASIWSWPCCPCPISTGPSAARRSSRIRCGPPATASPR